MVDFLSRLKGRADGCPALLLAPMAGYTDAAMRAVCSGFGVACTYTEMTNGYGLMREEEKTWHLLETSEGEGPVAAHLYGQDPAVMAEAARMVGETGRFVAVDLNAGCPVHKVTASGAGAALIHTPERVYEILHAMVRATDLPVTLKTRLGPSPDRVAVFELLDAAERAGAKAITVHARFTSKRHSGDPDLAILAEVKRRATIPVIANGGIFSRTTAWRTWHETGCDALMIARAAIGNPWLFTDILDSWNSDAPPEEHRVPGEGRCRRDLGAIRQTLYRHLAEEKALLLRIREKYQLPTTALTPEEALAATFRCHLFRYLHGLQGSGHLRRHLHELKSEADIRAAVEACLENEAGFRAAKPPMKNEE
ncbi:MAG: tRNA-dihydrouridine synthase family protein [Kiritimatiellae bacterium]|nr:tRNA-dihydrouridine synthase family protein [Kiritimatiellia bacterium]